MTEDGEGRPRRPFRTRSFTSLVVLWSFIVLAVSGVIIYLTPSGRIATWTRWSFLGIDKTGWQGLHTIFSLFFIAFVVLHTVFNWRPLVSYFRERLSAGVRLKRELGLSLLVVIALFAAAAARLEPVWLLSEWRDAVKYRLYQARVEPPVGRADELSVAELGALHGMSIEQLRARLKAETGIELDDPYETWGHLARENDVAPQELYGEVFGDVPRAGSGRGQRRSAAASSEELAAGAGPTAVAPEEARTESVPKSVPAEPAEAEHPPATAQPAPEVHRAGAGTGEGGGAGGRGRGYGAMTLSHLCSELGIPSEDGVRILAGHGIKGFPDERLRTIADRQGLIPSDIARLIEGR